MPGRFLMVMRPSPGEITSPYGWRIHPVTGVRTHHNGVDMGWGNGWDIVAPEPGVVVAYHVRGIENYGRRLDLLGDSGTLHYFAHTERAYVTSGRVTEGQKVAVIGNTGLSAFPHLHWETRLGGTRLVDPMVWLDSFSTPAGGTPTPFPTTPNEGDEDMTPRQIHYTMTGGKIIRALCVPGTGYFVKWSEVASTYANNIAEGFQTGGSVEITEAMFKVFEREATAMRPRDALSIEIAEA